MKVLVAIDSFKGSLSSLSAGEAVREAILKAHSEALVKVCALADGGEGTVEALASANDSELVEAMVHDPLMRPVKAKYCILGDKKTAVIEMAAASGITLISEAERNPLKTTTFGVGELISDAIERGCRRFIIGIGGSATNDGGTGMLSSLGFRFLDETLRPIPLGAKGLERLYKIETENALPLLRDCEFNIACDVKNPLCGPSGCSAVFGPQKGATPEMIEKMDSFLLSYAQKTKEIFPLSDKDAHGAGAAGGLGFAFMSFLGGKLSSGIELILKETKLEEDIKAADIVITGEGRLDAQTVMGKAPIGVAALAKKHNKKVIAFCGAATDEAEIINEHGIDAFFPILRGVVSLDDALNTQNAYKNLVATAYQVFRLL